VPTERRRTLPPPPPTHYLHHMYIGFSRVQMLLLIVLVAAATTTQGFSPNNNVRHRQSAAGISNRNKLVSLFAANKGFGSSSAGSSPGEYKKKKARQGKNRLKDFLEDKPKDRPLQQQQQQSSEAATAKPYVKAEQDALLEQLARQAATTPIGRAVAEFAPVEDPFWDLMPALVASRFPKTLQKPADLDRIAGFVRHALTTAKRGPHRPTDWVNDDDPLRPWNELHAYMPDLGPTQPFHDPATLKFCQSLEENYGTILAEYQALLDNNMHDKFQSVTSMNYESGWKTLVLFYNGHRIPKFPYHLCPVTTRLLESVPLAGRIAGFNRQQPGTGIPEHTDGNNMWLTTQMGLLVPDAQMASIRVGPETRHWEAGRCLLYDTTYRHETRNAHPTQERVVLHVDLFNTMAMTPTEIEILQYIYSLREEFMKAEGVAKVGAQIL
jgi:aspartyl/asparaginyl beta-hydroxylase (cupin superfamily)